MALTGKLTKKLVENLDAGRHGDGGGLYLVCRRFGPISTKRRDIWRSGSRLCWMWKGFRTGENPVTAIQDAQVLPKVKAKPKHHSAMAWQDVPAFFADLKTRDAMAAKALMFT